MEPTERRREFDRRRFLRRSAVVAAGAGTAAAVGPARNAVAQSDYVRRGELVVNVKDHGAVGDGATNDSAAIQAAQEAGTAVLFPAGTYLVDAGALRPRSGATWFGQGAQATRIRLADGQAGDVVTISEVTGVHLHDLTINGNRANSTSGAGIALRDVLDVKVERVDVVDVSDCSVRYSGRVRDVYVEHCRLLDMGVRGIGPEGPSATDVSLERFSFSFNLVTTSAGTRDPGSQGFGIQIAFARDGVVQGNVVDGGDTRELLNGLILRASHAVAVTSNVVRQMVDDGITIVDGCRDISIIGNSLTQSQLTCGVFFIDGGGPPHSRISIVGNNLSENWLASIRLAGVRDSIIEGNSCCNNARFGIAHPGPSSESTETSDVTIASNTISGNGESGILLAGGTEYLITGNVCRGNGLNPSVPGDRSGLQLMNVSRSSVIGNRFTDVQDGQATQEHGITLLNSSRNVISENVCTGNQEHGIYLVDSGHNLVSSNRIEGNSQLAHAAYNGIDIAGNAGHNSVQGNQIRKGTGARQHGYALNISAPSTLVRGNDLYEASVAGGIYAINIDAGVPETAIEENRALPTTVTVSSDYAASPKERAILVNASGGARTVTLPRAWAARHRHYTIKKIDSSPNPVVVAPSGSDKIDGEPNLSLGLMQPAAGLLSDGYMWRTIY